MVHYFHNASKTFMTLGSLEAELLCRKWHYVFDVGTKKSSEQKGNIKFCWNHGKLFIESFHLMQNVHGDICQSFGRVQMSTRSTTSLRTSGKTLMVGRPNSWLIQRATKTCMIYSKFKRGLCSIWWKWNWDIKNWFVASWSSIWVIVRFALLLCGTRSLTTRNLLSI